MGIVNYIYTNLLKACVLHPVKPQPSDYEIRLKDGSDIRASGLEVSNGQLVIHEVSGITVPADPGEVAQFRAGLTHVQTLIDLPWKATALAANPSPAASAPPTAPTAPAAVPAPAQAPFLPPLQPLPPLPTVRCWEGNNAEQIMAAEPGTVLDFPLTGKIRALALRVAVLSDTPNAQAIVRILADGREIGRTPAFKAGDQPRFVQVTLQDPKTLTLVADSLFSDTRILYIDPVVIQE